MGQLHLHHVIGVELGMSQFMSFSLPPLQANLIRLHSDFTALAGHNLLPALHYFLRVLSPFDFLISLICMKTRSLALEILSAEAANAAY